MSTLLTPLTSRYHAPMRHGSWVPGLIDSFFALDVVILDDQAPHQITSRKLGDMVFSVIDVPRHVATRSSGQIADDSTRRVVVTYLLEGEIRVKQGGLETVVHPGEFAFFDWESIFSIEAPTGYRAVVLQLPREALLIPVESFSQRVSPGIRPIGAFTQIIPGYFTRLADFACRLQGWSGERVARTAVELASAVFAAHARSADTWNLQSADFVRATDFAERHLADPQLDAQQIATALFVSVRQLHKIFELEGTTVSRWIRDRRLEKCRSMLTDPAFEHMCVGDIGTTWGFFNRAHFSRIYRAKYACSPREQRYGTSA